MSLDSLIAEPRKNVAAVVEDLFARAAAAGETPMALVFPVAALAVFEQSQGRRFATYTADTGACVPIHRNERDNWLGVVCEPRPGQQCEGWGVEVYSLPTFYPEEERGGG